MVKNFKKKENNGRLKNIVGIGLVAVTCFAGISLAMVGLREWKNLKKLDERITFQQDTVAKLNNENISMAEFMLYSVDIRNDYESQYGSDIWNEKTTDAKGKTETFENVAKENVLEQIRFVKALNKEGAARKMSLSKAEKKAMDETAGDYYKRLNKNYQKRASKSLKEDEANENAITKQDVERFYKEQYYAQKVYSVVASEYKDKAKETIPKDQLTKTVQGKTTSEIAALSNGLTTKEAQELWTDLINKYYPEFDYDLDVNWNFLNEISFAVKPVRSEAAATGTSTQND